MKINHNQRFSADKRGYTQKTADDYIGSMKPEILEQLESPQLDEIRRLLQEAIPKPSPKIVDLRFVVDLVFSRFYVVLFVGKDRRKNPRPSAFLDPITYIGNLITVIVLLVSFNLTLSIMLVLILYLLKSALGVDILPGHFPDLIQKLFGK